MTVLPMACPQPAPPAAILSRPTLFSTSAPSRRQSTAWSRAMFTSYRSIGRVHNSRASMAITPNSGRSAWEARRSRQRSSTIPLMALPRGCPRPLRTRPPAAANCFLSWPWVHPRAFHPFSSWTVFRWTPPRKSASVLLMIGGLCLTVVAVGAKRRFHP